MSYTVTKPEHAGDAEPRRLRRDGGGRGADSKRLREPGSKRNGEQRRMPGGDDARTMPMAAMADDGCWLKRAAVNGMVGDVKATGRGW